MEAVMTESNYQTAPDKTGDRNKSPSPAPTEPCTTVQLSQANQMFLTELDNLNAQISAFIEDAMKVTTPDEHGRARFPEFQLRPVIITQLNLAIQQLENGDLRKAMETFKGAKKHFANQQVAYARSLRRDLEDEIHSATRGELDEDLLASIKTAVEAYCTCVCEDNTRWFDLAEASRLYWAAIDALVHAHNENRSRREEKKRATAAFLAKRCVETAGGLRDLLNSMTSPTQTPEPQKRG